MKRIMGLVILTFMFCTCLGRIIKEPREYIFSLLSDTSIVWERDDNNCYIWDIIIFYPKKANVIETEIKTGNIWSKYYNKYVDDTIISYRGTGHTWDFWIRSTQFDTFYQYYDYYE